MRTRGDKLSKEFHDHIATEYMFKGLNAYQIAEKVNGDNNLMSKFGKTTAAGVYYHIKQIQEEMENTINEDAMDIYIAEFLRARIGFDQDVVAMEGLIKLATEDGEMSTKDRLDIELKLRRHRHEIKLDSFKMLQDNALPMTVKKLKKERQLYRPKPVAELEKVDEDAEGSSE
jgi:hypothetical protein